MILLATCPETFDTAQLVEAASGAEYAFTQNDTVAFASGRETVLARLRCQSDPLSPAAIARVHRVQALAAFLETDEGRVAAALAGLLTAEPGHQLPMDLIHDRHRIRAQLGLAGLMLREPGTEPLLAPPSGWIEVNGTAATSLPTVRTAVLQRIDGQGHVVQTHYWWPGDDLGGWRDDGIRERVSIRPRVPLAIGTGVALAGAGVLYGLATTTEARFHDATTERSLDELASLRTEANALSWGWIGASAASLGLGAALVITW